MDNQLQIIVEQSGLEQTKAQVLLDNFSNYFQIASEWEKKAKMIKVVNESQTDDMKLARVGRLALREKRITLEKKRKELKEQSLREGKAIDGIANTLKAVIVPIEEYLEKQEKFVEIKTANKQEAERLEAEKKEEEERIAKEKADVEERERIRIENEKLKKEAEERERVLQEERTKAEAERKKQEEKLRKEIEEADRKRKEAEMKAKAEQEKIKKEAGAKAEAERKEKERLQELLKNQIECPHCHKTFQLPKEKR